jgi:hypothetical protein
MQIVWLANIIYIHNEKACLSYVNSLFLNVDMKKKNFLEILGEGGVRPPRPL